MTPPELAVKIVAELELMEMSRILDKEVFGLLMFCDGICHARNGVPAKMGETAHQHLNTSHLCTTNVQKRVKKFTMFFVLNQDFVKIFKI